ncbi:helix-turn-helix domain-containing protein [Streptomyces sp. NPDC054919]
MLIAERARTSRPCDFDVEAAANQALRVSWTKGYGGASMADLAEAVGVNRPSLHAAFGNEEEVFRKALDLDTHGPRPASIAAVKEPIARRVAASLLRSAVEASTVPLAPAGCLLARGALVGGDTSKTIKEDLGAAEDRWMLNQGRVCRHELAFPGGVLPASLMSRAGIRRPQVDGQRVINGMVHKIRTGITRRGQFGRYGSPKRGYALLHRYALRGVVTSALGQVWVRTDVAWDIGRLVQTDSNIVRACRHATAHQAERGRQRKGEPTDDQALGRSRESVSTKACPVCDDRRGPRPQRVHGPSPRYCTNQPPLRPLPSVIPPAPQLAPEPTGLPAQGDDYASCDLGSFGASPRPAGPFSRRRAVLLTYSRGRLACGLGAAPLRGLEASSNRDGPVACAAVSPLNQCLIWIFCDYYCQGSDHAEHPTRRNGAQVRR